MKEVHLETLRKILRSVEYGDEDGFSPDLSFKEIEAIEWAVEELSK